VRVIHRAWEGLSPSWVLWTEEAVRSTHPGARVRTARLDPALPGPTPARRSNIHRLNVLLDQGGLWLDCDVVPLANLLTLWDEPWMGYQNGKLRPGIAFFPEGNHPLVAETLERALADPGTVLANHVAACKPTIRPEPRVLPHDAKGRWVLGNNQEPLAVHLWLSSGRLIP
jgi:mannosyltransferase OCH1-like enzyme